MREAYVKLAETPAAAWYCRDDAVREARALEEVYRELDPTYLLFCDPEWLASRIPPWAPRWTASSAAKASPSASTR